MPENNSKKPTLTDEQIGALQDPLGIVATYLNARGVLSLAKTCKSIWCETKPEMDKKFAALKELMQLVAYGQEDISFAILDFNKDQFELFQELVAKNQLKDELKQKIQSLSIEKETYKYKGFNSEECKVLKQFLEENKEQDLAKKLLIDNVKSLLDEDSSFLQIKLPKDKKYEVKDFSRRKYSGLTPFQLALCNGDVEMCEMMKPYFAKLENGQAEMQEQYNEIFPKGMDLLVKEQKKAAEQSPLLDNLAKALTAANNTDKGKQELQDVIDLKGASFTQTEEAREKKFDQLTLVEVFNRFREESTKLFQDEHKNNHVFNPYHLLKAYKIYEQNYDNWTIEQCQAFWCQAVGYFQRFVPSCYAQAFAQGIYYIVENDEKLNRSFKFKHADNSSFCPINFVSCSGLGFNYAADAWGPQRLSFWTIGTAQLFQKLCQTKTRSLENYAKSHAEKPSSPACNFSTYI